jgi:hypothetical protein
MATARAKDESSFYIGQVPARVVIHHLEVAATGVIRSRLAIGPLIPSVSMICGLTPGEPLEAQR